ncbi:MAG: hypothetical protein HETSPECPRED_004933 [Heterodermia speciosa]|uniref:Phosphoglycerate mutase n=1 Tax=Heterodermia speciosa TaxID=116794 RepID=A0A8H3EHA4_9LECA|nr:MAG: hypothetical protein HETSPECPRED_004933 [Heterodermia speciosa]
MGKPPAVVIVARHGSRLDVADKQWHLTSPAPYDPPLTYNGWRQAHALGSRIATILHHRQTVPDFHLPNAALKHSSIAEDESRSNAGQRKHKVIIHTSPFLRCIQTSIGISGGMAEAHMSSQNSHSSESRHTMHSAHPVHSGSPHIRAKDHLGSPRLSAIHEPLDESQDQPAQENAHSGAKESKPHLRVDAFLGEWLSPGYFEDITHPPGSRLMVATAKANLLHEKNYAAVTRSVSKTSPTAGNFPGGWGSGKAMASNDGDSPLSHLTGLNQTLPRLNRSGSHSSAGSLAHRGSFSKPGEELASSPADDGYVSPVPSYALSPLSPIPSGYVAYAKNSCLDVDYQWDSMRSPREWGDGGEIGEEWSAMHKRFRRGLQEMISWYRQHDNTKHVNPKDEDGLPEYDDSENTDTVLVLVTHSAGCNALIGALTNQPVLLDAGMASLTMAVRKPAVNGYSGSPDHPPSLASHRRNSSVDVGVSEDYDVKIVASTDHLRPGSLSSSSRSSRAPSPSASGQRFQSTSLASTTTASSTAAEEGDQADNVGLLKRSATATAPTSTGLWTKPATSSSNGLWNKPVDLTSRNKPSHEASPLRESTTIKNISVSDAAAVERDSAAAPTSPPVALRGRDTAIQGLWGAPPPTPPSDREKGPKRRWTLNEQR